MTRTLRKGEHYLQVSRLRPHIWALNLKLHHPLNYIPRETDRIKTPYLTVPTVKREEK